mmetsp:Transcript_61459/g.139126  ORF Transcript_61459/g.139126 Transcript_61459/m.139126 type:complete len:231 (-) Transcript_61459:1320-2012(-)
MAEWPSCAGDKSQASTRAAASERRRWQTLSRASSHRPRAAGVRAPTRRSCPGPSPDVSRWSPSTEARSASAARTGGLTAGCPGPPALGPPATASPPRRRSRSSTHSACARASLPRATPLWARAWRASPPKSRAALCATDRAHPRTRSRQRTPKQRSCAAGSSGDASRAWAASAGPWVGSSSRYGAASRAAARALAGSALPDSRSAASLSTYFANCGSRTCWVPSRVAMAR